MAVAIDLDVFAVLPGARSAVVTPLGGAPVTTIVQWDQETASPSEQQLGAGMASALNRRLVASVRRDEVPTLPVGSTIAVTEPAARTYRVQSVDAGDPDFHVAVVL